MKKSVLFSLVALLVVGLLATVPGCKKDEAAAPGPSAPTQINANGSLAPTSRTQAAGTVFVSDQNGNPVTGLTAQNVTAVLRWGTPGPAKVAVFDSVLGSVLLQSLSQSGKSVAVGMTMDYSGSMEVGPYDPVTQKYQRILLMESAVKTFVNAMQASDIAEIIKFDHRVQVFQLFTSSKPLLLYAADSVANLYGSTALDASIVKGLNDAALQSSASYARAVVAFTDGMENASFYGAEDSLYRVSRRHAIPVYTVGLLDSIYHTVPPGQASYGGEKHLVNIADSTGGFYYYAPSAADLAAIYAKISGQISNAYSITITWPASTLPAPGTLVNAIVTVRVGNLTSTFTRQYAIP